MDQNDKTKPSVIKKLKKNPEFYAGLSSGVLQAGIFNPWDRALYLSVIENRPFLDSQNWKHPFHGFFQSVIQRTVSGGLYFFLQEKANNTLKPLCKNMLGITDPGQISVIIGMSAGTVNGMILNEVAVVKYHTWGKEGSNFFSAGKDMWKKGGYKPFFKGMMTTALRDCVFGIAYEYIRQLLREQKSFQKLCYNNQSGVSFFSNLTAAGIATLFSAPLNYCRNIKYGTPPAQRPPTIFSCLKDLTTEASTIPTFKSKCSFFQNRLRLGWGTFRVAVGMAFGQAFFDVVKQTIAWL